MTRPRAADDFATSAPAWRNCAVSASGERRAKPKYSQTRQCGPAEVATGQTGELAQGQTEIADPARRAGS
jgi:hypothetical protein